MDSGKLAKENLDLLAQDLLNDLNAGHSENYKEYLKFASQFRRYSFGNLMLIKSQMPNASRVASFNKWNELGYSVRKGQKSLKILAPLVVKKKGADFDEVEESFVRGYRLVSVFDCSQLSEPLEVTCPIAVNSDDHLDLYLAVKSRVEAAGVVVREVEKGDNSFGCYWSGAEENIEINSRQSNHDKALTIIHELSHFKLGHGKPNNLSKAERECQAESVSYIVANALGMSSEISKDYLLSYGADAKMFMRNLNAIMRCAQEILDMLSVLEDVEYESNTTPAVA